MSDEVHKKLSALSAIAQLKSDRAVAELAAAKRAFDATRDKIKGLDAEVQAVLTQAADPLSMRLAIGFSGLKRQHRADLLAELARCELRRKTALKIAQTDEGKRIALEKLRDQAS